MKKIQIVLTLKILNSGFSIEDPNAFAKRTYKMILFGLQDDSLPATETEAKKEEKPAEGASSEPSAEEKKEETKPNSFLESID